MRPIRYLLAALWGRALKIQVDGVYRVFTSPEELMIFLKRRTQVPDGRMREFAGYDEHALKREARKMMHAHQNIMNVMVGARETGEPLSSVWRHLDISKVPDDHDWPSILFALGKEMHAEDAYRHEALTQYLGFLEKRREVLDGLREPEEVSAEAEGAPDGAPARDELRGYSRLPHCRTVEVDLTDKSDTTVFLGTNRYHISRNEGSVAFEEGANVEPHVLKPGRSTIGRSSHCDVRLEDDLRDISRQHLVVEVGNDHHVSVMDVSSRGTYMRDERFMDARDDTLADTKS